MPTRYDAYLRHAARCVALLQSLERHHRCDGADRAKAEFRERWAKLASAQSWAAAEAGRGDSEGTRFCNAFATACGDLARGTSLLEIHRPPEERVRWLEAGLLAARSLNDRRQEATHAYHLGLALAETSQYPRSLVWLGHARELWRDDRDAESEGVMCNAMGLVYRVMGQTDEALRSFMAALRIARQLGRPTDAAHALDLIGSVHAAVGDRPQAVSCRQEALAIYRALGERDGEASVLRSLSIQAIGEVGAEGARGLLDEIQKIGDSAGHLGPPGSYCSDGMRYGLVYAAHADARALPLLERELDRFRASGDRAGEAFALLYLGVAFRMGGDHRRSVEVTASARDAFRSLGNELGMALALQQLGHMHNALAEVDRSLACHREAAGLFLRLGYRAGEAGAHCGCARASADIGDLAGAIESGERAAVIYADLRHPLLAEVQRQLEGWRLRTASATRP